MQVPIAASEKPSTGNKPSTFRGMDPQMQSANNKVLVTKEMINDRLEK